METKKSVFEVLNAINCNEHTDKKNGLTYLAWAWAWAEVKKAFPDSFYTIYENADGLNYHTDGRTAWVKTGVTIEGLELIEYLPVMDYKNNSIPLERITSFDVNKTIQRSLTKACARHGLGLYIYAGEDLPEESTPTPTPAKTPKAAPKTEPKKETPSSVTPPPTEDPLLHPATKLKDEVKKGENTLPWDEPSNTTTEWQSIINRAAKVTHKDQLNELYAEAKSKGLWDNSMKSIFSDLKSKLA